MIRELETEVGIEASDQTADDDGPTIQGIKAVAELEIISEIIEENLDGVQKDLQSVKGKDLRPS